MSNQRILFMGTPEFAVATLDALVADGLDVCAVVTAPDRPAGRGRQLRASAVKERALELGLTVLQPERLKDPAFIAQLDALDASLYVVVAFRMLPEVVWARPKLGTVNLHGSLLPAYRGAAPINWAVINGERRTGVTTFLIQHEIDTGDVLLQESTDIGPEDTAGDVHDRLMTVGAALMVRTVHDLFDGTVKPVPQRADTAGTAVPLAPKLTPVNTRVHFDRPAQEVHDLVRGLSPFPGAWCEWKEGDAPAMHCKLLRTRVVQHDTTSAPGTVYIEGDKFLVACGTGRLQVMEIQLEGRKRLPAAELLRGMRISGTVRLQ
ncbi:MAG: methionyl-tRNA formyltransferase [Flavobacteriales bacterium]|nr:methionyl-tRNA formyltransferase [Flavobacteriales bacterium]